MKLTERNEAIHCEQLQVLTQDATSERTREKPDCVSESRTNTALMLDAKDKAHLN